MESGVQKRVSQTCHGGAEIVVIALRQLEKGWNILFIGIFGDGIPAHAGNPRIGVRSNFSTF
jgi:hypothetical protein